MIEQIGRYKIQRELGRGGFGQVYLAHDPMMNRQVAVKVLTQMDDPSMIARFRTEAVAAGNLRHPNIVTIYDFGEEKSRHYLVMEFLDGRDLQKVIASKEPMALWQKVDIMSQIAEGLHCAHQFGVVHRDVKPANVIVLRDGTVKILDFGIARLTERDDTRLTKSGFMVGTVLYMAPEQLSEGNVDALSDIWAYGLIYYEILTRRHPFAAQDQASMMYRIMNQEPEPVSSLAPECPEALSRIVARLLAKQRENRYQSLADLQYDVLPLLRELKRQQATGFLSKAAGLMEGSRYEEAQQIIRSILDLDPGNAEAERLREKLAQTLKRQSVRPKVEKLLETVETQAAARNYPDAIRALEKAHSLDPGDASLPERIEALRAKQRQNDKAQHCLVEARQQLELQNLTEAFKQAKDAVSADPGVPAAIELLDKIQRDITQRDRERNVQRAINRAKGLLLMEVFDEALELLRKTAEEYPGNDRIEDLLRHTQRQKAEKEAREKVAVGIAAARNLIKKRSFAPAIAALDALHREYPADTELAGLLGFARDELATEERAAAIERLGREAWTLARNRDFDASLRCVGKGLETYPGDESLMRVMQATLAAKAEHEKSQALQGGLARCQRLREQGSIHEALALSVALLRDHPGNPELLRLRDELQREEQQNEDRRMAAERDAAVQREITQLLADATRRADTGDWDSAVKIAEDGARRYPSAPKLKEAAEYLRRKKNEADSVLELDSAFADIQRSLAARQLDAAGQRLARARRECRPDARLDGLEMQLQEAVFRQERVRAADDKVREGAFTEAERELQSILDRDPQDPTALTRLADVRRKRAAEDRNRKYDAGRAEAARLLRERQFDPALNVLDALLADYPGDPLLLEESRAAREAKERSLRADAVARGRLTAEDFLRNKNFAKAIWLYEELEKRYPEEFAVGEDLKAARAAKEDYERIQAYAAGRSEIDGLMAQRDFQGAVARCQSLQQQFPNDPLLPDVLKAAMAAQEDYRRTRDAGSGRSEVESLLRERRFPEAIARLQTLVLKFPDDVALRDLLPAALEANDQARRTQSLVARRAEAEKLAGERSYEAAIRVYQDLLKDYPGDRALAEGLTAVKKAQAEEVRNQVYARGRAEAERLAAARAFDAAIERYRSLLQQYPRDTALEEGLAAAIAARDGAERKRVYALGRKAIDEALRAKNFAEAIQLLESLQKRCPEEPGITEEINAVRALQRDHERAQNYSGGRAEAEHMLAARDFQGAIARYQAMQKQFPNDASLAEGLKAALAAEQEYRRKREAARGRGEVERLQRERKVSEAVALLESLVQKFPEDMALAEDLRAAQEDRDRTQRTRALTAARIAVGQLAADRSYEAAIRRYEDLLKEFPGDRALTEELAEVKQARAAEIRKQAYERGRGEAEKLASARSFDAAIKRYRELLGEYPHDKALEEGLAAAIEAKDAAGRKQIYTQGREEAERLGRELQFAAAIRQLDGLLAQFPHDRALEEDRESLVAAQKSREDRLRIDKQLDQLEKLYRKGDAAGVKQGVERLLAEADSPRARELLKWAEGTLKRNTGLIAIPDEATPPRTSRARLILLASMPAVLVAAVFLYWSLNRPKPSTGRLTVTPERISFDWEKGTALPAPKSLAVTADGAWTLSKTDDWLLPKQMPGNPPDQQGREVEVSIAPERLAAGHWSGLLTISGGGHSQNVHVELTVRDAPPPAKPPQVVSFAAKLAAIPVGGSTEVCWHVDGAASIAIDPDVGGNLYASDCHTVSPKTTTTYVLTAANSAGSVPANAVVKVEPAPAKVEQKVEAPRVLTFAATPQSIPAGGSSKLCWQVTNAASIVVQPGAGVNPNAGNCATVSPAATTTYTLTASNSSGQITAKETVTVTKPAVVGEPPVTDQPVDCKSVTYPGLTNGTLTWNGDLPANGTLLLGRSLVALTGGGTWAGAHLPGCEVSLTSRTAGIDFDPPSAANNFSRLRVKNGSSAIRSLSIHWQVK